VRIRFTQRADKDYAGLPPPVRKAFAKQLDYLLANLRHPSLRAKKYDASDDLWQARVDRNWRFYFKIEGDEYAIFAIVPHPK
jgi:mRNA interferase RelE/StbE